MHLKIETTPRVVTASNGDKWLCYDSTGRFQVVVTGRVRLPMAKRGSRVGRFYMWTYGLANRWYMWRRKGK